MAKPRCVYDMTIDEMKERVEYNHVSGKFYLLSRGFPSVAGYSTELYQKGDRLREITVVDADGYVKISIKGTGVAYIRAHRYAWAYHYGVFPSGYIDHINGVTNDNRIDNLRMVSSGENSRNMKIPSSNTSGTVGVSFNKQSKKWRANIWVNNKQKSVGVYKTKEEAIEARLNAEVEYNYHKNHGRKR